MSAEASAQRLSPPHAKLCTGETSVLLRISLSLSPSLSPSLTHTPDAEER